MDITRRRGFTLIELLTVIAIIAILAGITFTVLPRVRESAKLARTDNAFNQIRTSMTQYFADTASYPPGYGFLAWESREKLDSELTDGDFFLKPYTALIQAHNIVGLYDEWSAGATNPYDANQNGQIDPLEFLPVGLKKLATNVVSFPETRYTGSNVLVNDPEESGGEFQRMQDAESRPFIYVPVNLRQFQKARKFWIESNDWYAENWNNAIIDSAEFPPAKYDAYALISVGPGADTFGVVPDSINGTVSDRDRYHVLSLRAFFLATRDLNQNTSLDFDYRARTREGEAALTYEVNGETVTNRLDSTRAPDGYGPLIYVLQ
jgi:prepilin-type N-terminal cleavage/methylation domain-containing protein